MPKAPSFTDVGIIAALEEGGVLTNLRELITSLSARLPEGMKPNAAQLDALLAQAMSALPGVLHDAIDKVKPQLIELAMTGKGPISDDPSARA